LEELHDAKNVEYDAWFIQLSAGDQFTSGFTAVNPNQKIPALLDYENNQDPIRVFEGGAILLYLAEKYGFGLPRNVKDRTECINWVFWLQGVAPLIGGGFGHFVQYAPFEIEYAIDRYAMEMKRILDLLNIHLEGKKWMMGDEISIADFAIAPWVKTFFFVLVLKIFLIFFLL
jgi:GST-like protein